MSIIRARNLSKNHGSRQVLREVSLRLGEGDRIGLIGKNGSGKTTLLKLLLGRDEDYEGRIETRPGTRIGYFSQFSELTEEVSVEEILSREFSGLQAAARELEMIGERLAAGPDGKTAKQLLNRQAKLLEEMEIGGGWDYQNRIDTVLTVLGFPSAYRKRPVGRLSGGWRNRAAFAQILIQMPDVLLLDEPTNYLDVEGLDWLERRLQEHRGALVVVSHDRHFLDAVVSRIVEIENYHLQDYEGNFTQYVREKKLRMKTLASQFRHEEELLILEAEAIQDRQEAMRTAGKSLKRKLANVKKWSEPRPMDKIITQFYDGLEGGDRLCWTDRISKAYGSETLFRDLSVEIRKGEKLVIVGRNGCGKSTLLAVLTQALKPDSGRTVWPPGSEIPFADFNAILEGLDPSDMVFHAVKSSKLVVLRPKKLVAQLLELMQFSEADQRAHIGNLSGGQKARVALAKALLSGAPVVLLDEPTNHLDLTSIQVMERMLIHFPGAVIMVSHDRFFIDKVATRLLVFGRDGATSQFTGSLTEWQAVGAG